VLETAVHNGDERAEVALEIFAYRVCKYIGAYAAALEGLDAIAFTGGVGENSADIRSRVCRRLKFLGIQLDADLNAKPRNGEARRIGVDGSAVQVWTIPTDEERQIARNVLASRLSTD